MKTIKTISNISYNTPQFFKSRITDLYSRGVIDWAYWIVHNPDTDETKQHIHFVLKPSARLDTSKLRDEFNEVDANNIKPLTCTTKWNTTNSLEDWLLYAVHDRGYLASKGQRRNIRYEYADLQSTDEDALRQDWNAIDRIKFDRLRLLSEAVENRTPFALLVQQGIIPMPLRGQYEFQYKALLQLKIENECGRKTAHECDDDGVIIEEQEGLSPSALGFQDASDVSF